MKRTTLSRLVTAAACLAAFACSASSRPAAPAAAPAASLTPTPGPIARINPNVIEETETYTIQRFPKQDYIRVDDRHIRHPMIGPAVEFFKEDESYYYVYVPKPLTAEEVALREAKKKALQAPQQQTSSTPAPVAEGPPDSVTDQPEVVASFLGRGDAAAGGGKR